MLSSRWASFWRHPRTPWLLLIMLIAVAGVALWAFLDYQRSVVAITLQSNQHMTRLTAARIRDELANFANSLVALARSDGIVSQDTDLQVQALRKAPPIREGLFDGGIVVLNNFGSVTAVEPPRPDILQQDWSDRTYFRQLLDSSPSKVVFSDSVGDGPLGSQVIVVGVPVWDGQGRFVGAIAGMLRLSQPAVSPYYAALVKLRVSEDGNAYLVDRNGRILFDSASLHEGEQYANFEMLASGETDPADAGRTRDLAGREILLSDAPIPGTPWTLVIEKDWENLIAPTKPHSNLLLALLGLGVVLSIIGYVLLIRQRSTWFDKGDPIRRESHLTHQIERALLPEQTPILPGWDIAVHRDPAPILGRVFYDVLVGMDGCLWLIIAETGRHAVASSDGVPAVLSMVAVRTLLRSAVRCLLDPGQALANTNRQLCPELQPGDTVSCLYCKVDPASGVLHVGNADHMRPLKVTGDNVDVVGGKDSPLALQLDSQYCEYTSILAPGECMVFYSSEVLDARNAEGEQFGLVQLQQMLSMPAEDSRQRLAGVISAIRDFAGGDWANDRDAILIVLDRLPAGNSQMQED